MTFSARLLRQIVQAKAEDAIITGCSFISLLDTLWFFEISYLIAVWHFLSFNPADQSWFPAFYAL